jgi:hypothetical protein
MRPREVAGPAKISARSGQPQGVEIVRLDVRTSNAQEVGEQDNFAARFVAVRFHLPPNVARLVCELAGVGRAA